MLRIPVTMWFGSEGGGGRGGGGGAANSNAKAPASATGTRVKPAGQVGGGRVSPGRVPGLVPRPGGAANTNAGGRRRG